MVSAQTDQNHRKIEKYPLCQELHTVGFSSRAKEGHKNILKSLIKPSLTSTDRGNNWNLK